MYREITAEKKMEILKDYWRSGNLSKVAQENGTNRASVYKWDRVVEGRILEELKKLKPGKRNVSVEQQNERLKQQIKKLINILHKKEEKEVFDSPVFCPKCKSDRVHKNGKVITRGKGIQQRYICRQCSFSIYASLKKTL